MNDYVCSFIESFSLPKFLAETILKDEQDCIIFLRDFYNRSKTKTDDLLKFREHKIAIMDASFEEFIYCANVSGLLVAVQTYFLQSFTTYDEKLVKQKVQEGVTNYKSIFDNFKKSPNKNIMKSLVILT